MCQLFALSASAPTSVVFSFTGLSARGGDTGDHADGFGLAFHDGAACRLFVDEHRASDSALAEFLRQHPIRAHTVLAHIRKATQGAVEIANCHPFVRVWQGRQWSFCHNGDLQGFQPRLDAGHRPVGSTDSERAFCWMLQELRRRFRGAAAPAWPQLAPVLADLADRLAVHGSFNFLLSDGEALYVHGATRLFWLQRRHPFGAAQLVDRDVVLDLGLSNGEGDRMAVVATEPLTRNEPWTAFGAGEMRVFVAGETVWQRSPRPVAAGASAAAAVQPPAVAVTA